MAARMPVTVTISRLSAHVVRENCRPGFGGLGSSGSSSDHALCRTKHRASRRWGSGSELIRRLRNLKMAAYVFSQALYVSCQPTGSPLRLYYAPQVLGLGQGGSNR
jgi:hypothetical protein